MHLHEAVTYALNQKKELPVFLEHPEVEMTNNFAERTVKPFVIDRKNFLFSDTEKGAEASAAAMTIIETAKRNGIDVYGYLLYLLTDLPALKKIFQKSRLFRCCLGVIRCQIIARLFMMKFGDRS